ncbi:MAG: hypothetical protein Q8O05_03030 [Chloroflexota bacterium]|nr:hypothetical protein [Chloroflexota bacterium]
MVKNIFIVLLSLILSAASLMIVHYYSLTQELLFDLSETRTRLSESITQLEQTVLSLSQTQLSLSQTQTQLTQKTTELALVGAQLRLTSTELSSAKNELTSLKTRYDQLAVTAESNKFFFYYVKSTQQYGVDQLAAFLNQGRWARSYEANVFDCSEMSAYLERDLENAGFHTLIAIGKSPDGSGQGHAWLLAEASQGHYMPVEATAHSVVYWSTPYFGNYFKYDRTFETIQEALTYNSSDYDWWKP